MPHGIDVEEVYEFGPFVLNGEDRSLTCGGQRVELRYVRLRRRLAE